jgi:hypothetical protein
MTPAPRPQRRPYWTLVAFAGLLALPLGWGMAVLGGVIAARLAWSVYRGRVARRGRARTAARPGAVRLGTDPRGRPVVLGAEQLAAHGLIVGATGAGKSTTLTRILSEQIAQGGEVVALDLKGSPAFAAQLEQAAARAGRPFRLWSLDGPARWNPLAHGNPTELKDKLIGSEQFSEPHYRRAAERYLQTVLQVVTATGATPDLAGVVRMMEPRRLQAFARQLTSDLAARVEAYVESLTPDQLSAVRGMATRLALLSESSAGPYLSGSSAGPLLGQGPAVGRGDGAGVIDLRDGPDRGEVILFSLNASTYGSLAAQVGTLAVQDLVSVSGARLGGGPAPPLTVAIDEFSALGSDHVLALLARGRESGLSVLLATQELADLERAGRGFRDQVLGLTGVKIVHRQDVPASALMVAEMAGTRFEWDETRYIRSPFQTTGNRGARRQVERFQLHPNEIKALPRGQAVVLAKAPVAAISRVTVARAELGPAAAGPVPTPPPAPAHPPAPAPRALPGPSRPVLPRPRTPPADRSSPGRRGPERGDQPEPGVTR